MPKTLPDEALKLWEKVYDEAVASGDEKEVAAKKAYGAIKNAGWYKGDDDKWHKKSMLTEFSMRIEKAVYDKATNERRWRMVASDTERDLYEDEMSSELFEDFLSRIDANEQPPEDFRSEFWSGGMPYMSISHYPDLNGKGVPGIVDATYIDGTYLKARGRFLDTPLGRRCFESVCEDMYSKSTHENKIRVSIAFLDYGHVHKASGIYFERTEETPICFECLKELITGKGQGKIFKKGLLVHYALTRVPVNQRTSMEVEKSMAEEILTRKDDATSIVGEEEAKLLEEASALVGKSQTMLVTKADMEDDEEEDGGGCKGKKKKEDEVEEKSETVVDIASIVRSVVAEELAKMPTMTVTERVTHPLDDIYRAFCIRYDEVVNTNLLPDEKLRSLQDAFTSFGEQIISSVKSIPEPDVEQPSSSEGDAIVVALSQALAPLASKLELLLNKLDSQPTQTSVPARKSIQIAPTYVSPTVQAPVVSKSQTPKLRALVERTTR